MRNLAKIPNALNIKQESEKVGRLDIQGDIGFSWYDDGINDAKSFNKALAALGPVSRIEVHINSAGGSVMDGIAIYNALVQHPAFIDMYIDGVAASIASVIAMAGDKIYMPSNTLLFVHDPLMYTVGNAEALRKDADTLDTMKTAIVNSYLRHLKGSSDQIADMMSKETWISANEASEVFNNIYVLAQKKEVVAALDMSNLGTNIPKQAKAFLYEEEEPVESIKDKIVKCLNRRGFKKAAAYVHETLLDSVEDKKQLEEDDMKPEEIAALKDELKTETAAAVGTAINELKTVLMDAGVIPNLEKPKTPAPAVAFEGDPLNPEDVKAQLNKLTQAKGAQILASGDEAKIKEWLDFLTPEAPPATHPGKVQPIGNVHHQNNLTGDQSKKAEDSKDTLSLLTSCMPTV